MSELIVRYGWNMGGCMGPYFALPKGRSPQRTGRWAANLTALGKIDNVK
jgi:hypothetical protein